MMAIPTITVDMNKLCKRCKKKGATNSGYCLRCIAKMFSEGNFDHILKKRKEP